MQIKISKKLAFLVILFLLLSLSPGFFNYYKKSKIQSIPHESPEIQQELSKLISLSKYDPNTAILQLEELSNVSEYTEYKRDYILAKLHEQLGNNNEALSIYKSLLNKNYPLKERVIFHVANLTTALENDKEGLKYFNKLLQDFPNSKSVPQAKYYLAQTQLRLKLINQAVNTLRSLRIEFPDTQYGIATNYYLGEYEYNKTNYSEAFKYWREYLKQSPDGRFAEEIANIYNSITASNGIPLSKEDYKLLGDVFFHKKGYKEAAKYYRLVDSPDKYYNLGYSLYRTGNNEEAHKYLSEFAHKYPTSENIKLALYYASYSLPYNKRKSFWNKITKEIPELSYYTIYKEAQFEESTRKREKILKNLIVNYPQGEFTLDAAWEIIWDKIRDKDYKEAEKLGEQYFELSNNDTFKHTNTRAKIGYFLGKLAEIANDYEKAKIYYSQAKEISLDDYYSLRAEGRLKELDGGKDPRWKQQTNISDYNNFSWSIPLITSLDAIKNDYGGTVYELIRLQQFEEAMELIGRSKSSSEKVTSWLQALDNQYDISVNLANKVALENKLSKENPIWQIAYPLYYLNYILDNCKNHQTLDPFLVYGVIRQESRFDKNAVSVSDAHGLMQLIPPTARTVASSLSINLYSLNLLNDPQINIALGTKYLDGLVKDFNNPIFAVASYNAGPGAVKRWINTIGAQDIDFFIENIPYYQTKDYVKKVFASYWTYLKVYGDRLNGREPIKSAKKSVK